MKTTTPTTTPANPRRRNWRRYLVRAAISSACTSIVVLLIFWFTLQRKPAWYKPVQLDGAVLADVRREATAAADSFSDQLVRRKPFAFVLDGAEVTRWLAGLHEIAPEAAAQIPPEITAPAVSFADDCMRVGVHLESKGWRIIASAALTAEVSEGGRSIDLKLTGLSGGSMPLPRIVLDRVLGSSTGGGIKTLQDGDEVTVGDLLNGVRISNEFTWPNGQRRFRVEEIAVQDGRLQLRIKPL